MNILPNDVEFNIPEPNYVCYNKYNGAYLS